MGKLIDLTNNIYGRIHIIGRAPNKGKHTQWYGWCECEIDKPLEKRTIKSYSGDNLRNGHTKSCGCLQQESRLNNRLIDLTNQTFGRLIVIERAENQNGRTAWLCECTCGNKKIVLGESLKRGLTQSCGCLHNEQISQLNFKDLTGQKFGKLTVLYRSEIEERRNGSVVWHCICDCGNEFEAVSRRLLQGEVQSCGCLSISCGELKISNLLKENNINYIFQYTPENHNLSFIPKYDFYIPSFNTLIEYDGIQHFNNDEKILFNKEGEFEKRKAHDKEKNQWAHDNGITLIRIPYTHYDDLSMEDLVPASSTFIINKKIKYIPRKH